MEGMASEGCRTRSRRPSQDGDRRADLDHCRCPHLRVTRTLNVIQVCGLSLRQHSWESKVTDASVIRLRHFPETAHTPWTPSVKQRELTMSTTPTLEHERAAPRLLDAVDALPMVSLAPCENCGSSNVLSTLV